MIQFPPVHIKNALVSRPVEFSTSTRLNYIDNTLKFPEKLWLILVNENGAVASWSQDGTQFYLSSSPEFINVILPRYFKHNILSSFERQLNLYGFKRTKRQQFDICAYHHPYFQRGRKDLISYITRVINKSAKETHDQMDNVCDSNFKSIVSGFTGSEVASGPKKESQLSFIHASMKEIEDTRHFVDSDVMISVSSDMSTHSVASTCTSHESNSNLTKVNDASTCDSYDHYVQNNSVEISNDIDFSFLFDLDIPVDNVVSSVNDNIIPVLEPMPVYKKACRDTTESIIASNDSRHMEPNVIDLRSQFSHDLSKLATKYNVPYHVFMKCEQEMLAASKLVNTATTSTVSMTTMESQSYMTSSNIGKIVKNDGIDHHNIYYNDIQSHRIDNNYSTGRSSVSTQHKSKKRKQDFRINVHDHPHQNHSHSNINGYNHRPPPIQIPTTYNNTTRTRYHTEQRAMSSLMNPNHINLTGCFSRLNDSIPVSPFSPTL